MLDMYNKYDEEIERVRLGQNPFGKQQAEILTKPDEENPSTWLWNGKKISDLKPFELLELCQFTYRKAEEEVMVLLSRLNDKTRELDQAREYLNQIQIKLRYEMNQHIADSASWLGNTAERNQQEIDNINKKPSSIDDYIKQKISNLKQAETAE